MIKTKEKPISEKDGQANNFDKVNYKENNKLNQEVISCRDKIISLAINNSDFYMNQYGIHCIEYKGKFDNIENVAIKSEACGSFLFHLYLKNENKYPNTNAVKEAQNALEYISYNSGKTSNVSIRVGGDKNVVFIDVCNTERSFIKISSDGWNIINDSGDFRFIKNSTMKILPLPDKIKNTKLLEEFLNLNSDDDFILIVVWLVRCLLPEDKYGGYPILNIEGERGTGKTTFARIIKEIIDPNFVPLKNMPSKEEDLSIIALNNLVLVFDNLSGISSKMSDALCKVSTGGGFSTRRLYSNGDEFGFSYKRPVILNGINSVARKGDLTSRLISIELKYIEPSKRMGESDFWRKFNNALPTILSGLLYAVSAVLKDFDNNVIKKYSSRFPDFEKIGFICEKHFKWKEGSFINAYNSNIQSASTSLISSDVVLQAIIKFIEQYREYTGTTTDLYSKLQEQISDAEKTSFSKNPSSLGRKLKEILPILREHGIDYKSTRAKLGTEILIKSVAGEIAG